MSLELILKMIENKIEKILKEGEVIKFSLDESYQIDKEIGDELKIFGREYLQKDFQSKMDAESIYFNC